MPNQIGPVIIKSFEQLDKAELYEIMQLRIEVFVIEQDCPYPDLDGTDHECLHMWIVQDDQIASYLRINPAGSRYAEPSLGRIVTKLAHRSKGLGAVIINKAIEVVCQEKPTAIRISAQSHLENYYEKFGFVKASDEYLEDNIPHIEMLRDA
jgi:ElaA protein